MAPVFAARKSPLFKRNSAQEINGQNFYMEIDPTCNSRAEQDWDILNPVRHSTCFFLLKVREEKYFKIFQIILAPGLSGV